MQILKVGVALPTKYPWTKKSCVVTNPYKCLYLINRYPEDHKTIWRSCELSIGFSDWLHE